jgi:hypothetical protein
MPVQDGTQVVTAHSSKLIGENMIGEKAQQLFTGPQTGSS